MNIYQYIVFFVLLSSCSYGTQDVRETRFMMGTMLDFTVSTTGDQRQAAEHAIAQAASAMQAIEQQMTIYGEFDNRIKQLNRAPIGQAVTVPAAVDVVLQKAVLVEKRSGQMFSPSLAALNLLWGFSNGEAPKQPPEEDQIALIVQQHPVSCLQRSGEHLWIRSSESCQVDLGGIAKGYALDIGMRTLQQAGFSNAMINAGGDIRLCGHHHDQDWRIGIRDPRQKGEVIGVVSLSGSMSIVTSGDYERFYHYQGKRYHHILDPHSGYPALHYRSTTVILPTAMEADAWSTAWFVGGQNTQEVLQPSSAMLLSIDLAGNIWANAKMQQHLQLRTGSL